jgi:hypothetical protein
MPLDGSSLDPVVQTLLAAEDIIIRRGWIKGGYGGSGGPRCVVGALQEASDVVGAAWSLDVYKLRWDAGYIYGTTVGANSIECWQDRPWRTIEEIRDGFSRSIARAIEQWVAA